MGKRICFIIVSLVIGLTACGAEDDTLEILFFTEELSALTTEEQVSEAVQKMVPELTNEDFSITFHAAMIEKFSLEIAAQQGDIIFADEHFLEATMESAGIHPLDEILQGTSDIPEELYQQQNPSTGELKYYAIPMTENMTVVKNLDVELVETISTFIPAYTNHKELSMEVLEKLIEQRS
ncbi:hypothetical protein ACM26V_11935 [Salipaludibacillus sp. HK11]|uniref:hypothetical protein n=1 Tax=Salipaludibacillus sp. HK11 TaxID=3394320 RepID=UPI0039FD2603